MIKKIVVVAILLAIGVAIAFQLQGRKAADPVEAFQPQTGASPEVRIADLERALAAQIDRARTLENRMAELESRLGERREPGSANGEY